MAVDRLNYHHLYYFWMVAKEGSIAKACAKLQLAQPTVSTQIRTLEQALGERLFARAGRSLELTETGRIAFRFAEEIFALGREMIYTLRGRPSGRPLVLTVGIADALPKLVTHQLLQPALNLPTPVQLVCREDKHDRLLAGLAAHEFDVVLSDSPIPQSVRVRAFNHQLGECGVSFMASPAVTKVSRRAFPRCLEEIPLLLPTENTVLRRSLDQWFEEQGIRPQVLGEFEDTALMKVFGKFSQAALPVHSVVENEARSSYGVQLLGRVPELTQRFFAISLERKLKHPAVVAISAAARHNHR